MYIEKLTPEDSRINLASDFKVVTSPSPATKEIARVMLEMGSENARNYDLAKYFENKAQHLQDENSLLKRGNMNMANQIDDINEKLANEMSAHNLTKQSLDKLRIDYVNKQEVLAKANKAIERLKREVEIFYRTHK